MTQSAEEARLDPTSAEPRPFSLGVLFVHGIGKQQRGDTLVAFADPLYEWLHRWFTADDEVERKRRLKEEQILKDQSSRIDTTSWSNVRLTFLARFAPSQRVRASAIYRLGELCEQWPLGLEQARAHYQQAVDSNDIEYAPKAAFRLGLLLQRMGDVEGARTAYQWAMQSGHPEVAPAAGHTLRQLLDRFGDGLEIPPSAPVVLAESIVRSPADDPRAPAHTLLRFEFPPPEDDIVKNGRNTQRVTWCLAESCWANEFGAPKFSSLLRWAILIAPSILATHFSASLGRRWRLQGYWSHILRLPWPLRLLFIPWLLAEGVLLRIGMVLLPSLFGAVMVIALLVLFVLSLLPIPKLSESVRKAGASLTAVLGDSYVLVESPTQFDAMVARVCRDLGWLASQCQTVAVVAHSQGAVIAHHALRRWRPPNIGLFVTVGAGLSKLKEIFDLRRGPREFRSKALLAPWMITATFLVLIVLAVGLVRLLNSRPSGTPMLDYVSYILHQVFQTIMGLPFWLGIPMMIFVLSVPILPIAVFNMAFASIFNRAVFHQRHLQRDLDVLHGLRWIDYFTWADPVPHGPLFQQTTHLLKSHAVENHASVFRDHISYLRGVRSVTLSSVVLVYALGEGVVPLIAGDRWSY
jgi:hypothetical protein